MNIKQSKDSESVINLEKCNNFYKTKANHSDGNNFNIVFEFNNDSETWYYEKEDEMEKQFERICRISGVICLEIDEDETPEFYKLNP